MKGVTARLIRIGLFAVIYFVAARVGSPLTLVGGNTTQLWPQSGLALGVLLLSGTWIWPGIWLGAALAQFSTGVPLAFAALLGAGTTLGAALAAYIVRGDQSADGVFVSVRRVLVLCAASALGCAIVAAAGSGVAWLSRSITAGEVASYWKTWWLGDWTGILVLTPLVIAGNTLRGGQAKGPIVRGGLLTVGASSTLGLILFWNGAVPPTQEIALFVLTPVIVWSSLRFGHHRVPAILAALSVTAVAATWHGLGAFREHDDAKAILELQAFFAILSLTSLAVSALVEERRRAEEALRLTHEELERFVEERTAALRESEETFAKTFNSSPVGMAISTLENGRYLAVNDSFLLLLGYAREEVLGRTSWELGVFPGIRERERMKDNLLASGSLSEIEIPVPTKAGEIRDCRFNAEIIEVGGVRRLLSGLRDVTEMRRAEKLITHLAYHDSLTGLPNRLLFQDRFGLASLRARRKGLMLGLLYLDIDRFKAVNDSFGHAAGDWFLRCFAERLVQSVRGCDTVVRLGGDEFVVVLGDIQQAHDVGRVARKIQGSLAGPYELDQREIFSTVSIGTSVFPLDGSDGETLLRRADAAMYRAKSMGGDTCQTFTPTMNRKAAEHLGIAAELHRAIRGGEFVVYYQPQLTLASNRVERVEALVRWRHPKRGLLLPRSFMRVAEETGLIVPIDHFVLRQVCRDMLAWERAGLPPVRVAINVSLREFQQAGLALRIRNAIEEIGADPCRLDLEINEMVAINSIRSQRSTIEDLRKMGLRLSLDDFGHGHASLSHLRELPIETVKIDRSFVQRTTRDPRDAAVARAVISMVHALRMRVVAEGVDRLPLLDFLRGEDCDAIQGFFFSRPVPAAMLEELLMSWEGEAGRAQAA